VQKLFIISNIELREEALGFALQTSIPTFFLACLSKWLWQQRLQGLFFLIRNPKVFSFSYELPSLLFLYCKSFFRSSTAHLKWYWLVVFACMLHSKNSCQYLGTGGEHWN